ncbi:hypothetical protein GALMADRAFT_106133 [Galerina marginata CBS 339.88]|uniref:MARVEL domain-containing protein n=1 Tax=Galerina marginata (strain CBS 339.88) TaxID=685588 RepID=A0A067S9X0_GALM3|nr:hypothetical protein GALMADRAFT_106133 [Galerina marginata CBS 339.88]
MAPPQGQKKEADNRPFVPSIRSILYAITFFLIFCLTCAELGLVSQQIHKYGRYAENYASLQYKNVLGLLLCAVIISLLLCLTHFFIPIGFLVFIALILAIFFGVGGGVIRTATPYRGTSCNRPVGDYPIAWQPYAHECSRVVTIQALSWTLFALYFFILFGSLGYLFRLCLRPTPGGLYGSPTRAVV